MFSAIRLHFEKNNETGDRNENVLLKKFKWNLRLLSDKINGKLQTWSPSGISRRQQLLGIKNTQKKNWDNKREYITVVYTEESLIPLC